MRLGASLSLERPRDIEGNAQLPLLSAAVYRGLNLRIFTEGKEADPRLQLGALRALRYCCEELEGPDWDQVVRHTGRDQLAEADLATTP